MQRMMMSWLRIMLSGPCVGAVVVRPPLSSASATVMPHRKALASPQEVSASRRGKATVTVRTSGLGDLSTAAWVDDVADLPWSRKLGRGMVGG